MPDDDRELERAHDTIREQTAEMRAHNDGKARSILRRVKAALRNNNRLSAIGIKKKMCFGFA